MDWFSLGAKPGSDFASVRNWFDERSQILRFNVTGILSRSKFQGASNSLEGGSIQGVFAPAIRLTEDTALAFVYNGSYNRELQVFTEDEGPRQQQEEQRHEFIFLLSHDFLNPFGLESIDRLTISPSFFQTYVFTRQTQNEDWGNGLPWQGVDKFEGLYDYWDRGGGLEVRAVRTDDDRRRKVISAVFQIYRRHYRNFISLARLLNPASSEPKFEKDYLGYLGRIVYDQRAPGGASIFIAYTYLQKNFTEDRADQNPLETIGIPGERRVDRVHTVDMRGRVPVEPVPGLTIGIIGNVVYQLSNSGFNDTLTPLPVVGVFTDRYYDYWSFQAGPDISYTRNIDMPISQWRLKGLLTLASSYSFGRRKYKDRKAKDKAGNLKDEIEVDYTHVITPRVIFRFNPEWAVFFQWRRIIARSNFEDERVFRYNYDINTFGIGFQFTPDFTRSRKISVQ